MRRSESNSRSICLISTASRKSTTHWAISFGDKLLKAVAQRLTSPSVKSDLVARLGGDEFAILQKIDTKTDKRSGGLARRILAIFSEPFEIEGQHITVETSIGISLLPEHGMEAERLLKNADLALYKAKSEGRNTYRRFEVEHGTRRPKPPRDRKRSA